MTKLGEKMLKLGEETGQFEEHFTWIIESLVSQG